MCRCQDSSFHLMGPRVPARGTRKSIPRMRGQDGAGMAGVLGPRVHTMVDSDALSFPPGEGDKPVTVLGAPAP